MWDQSVEVILDQRQRSIPPILVKQLTSAAPTSGTVSLAWRVAATGRDRAVLTEVLSLVRSAKQVVVFSSFLLSEAEIQRELLAAASRGCRVYGLISAEARLDRDTSDEDEFDARVTDAHKRMLDEFAGRMVIRSSPAFHAKCVLVDPGAESVRGLLLTANLTTEALTRNEELAVRLNAVESRALFAQLRFAIWELAERELVGKGQLDRMKPLGEVVLPPADVAIQTTMGGRCQIRDSMLAMIAAAHRQIVVSSYGWDADHAVVEALCKRASEGVAVTVLARYRPTSVPTLLKLRRAGATVLCLLWLHAKALVCDDESMVMSANLQRHGLDDGFELGVRLSGPDTTALQRVLEQWIAAAPWRVEAPARLGDLTGEVVPLGPSSPPRRLDTATTIKSTATVTLDAVTAKAADRLNEAKLPEATLRQEAEKRGLTWVHEVRFQYEVRAPRLPAKAKPETPSKAGAGAAGTATTDVSVYRLPDGSRAVGIASPDHAKAARTLAESLGINAILAMEATP